MSDRLIELKKSFGAIAIILLFIVMIDVVKAKDIIIVKNKKALCRLVVPRKKDRWLTMAVKDLQDYIYKSSGAKVKIVYGKAPDDSLVNIHVGSDDYVKKLNPKMPSPQGFIIQFSDEKNIILAGQPVDGIELNTMYGAHRFLEKYIGVKWLFPLELGEYVPKHDTISVPMRNIVGKPSFFRRSYSGLDKVYMKKKPRYSGLLWGLRQGYMSGSGLECNHNIGNIFPPAKYTKTHPEFFPLINGKRYWPKPNPKDRRWRVKYWDPCYTAPGIVDEAVKNIIKYFDENPTKENYSLAVNDNVNVCQCKNCRAKNKDFPEGVSSQSYYEWCNAVVKKVRKKYPDKYFGLIVYPPVVMPPKGIVLDNHIVPVLCRDLGFYADAEIRKNVDEKLVESWHKVAPTLGWWDYTNSDAYIIPRVTSHNTANTLKYLYKNGLRFYSNEVHPGPGWKTAPQAYLRYKLLWNINLDTDKVLKEWYVACVGEKAAPYLEQYYDYWEDFWVKRATKTDWFRRNAGTRTYLLRKELGYLAALKQEDLDKCEKLLVKTCELAGTAKQKQRAKFIQDYFLLAKNKHLEPYIQFLKMSSSKKYKFLRGRVIQKFDCDKGIKSWKPWKRKNVTGIFYYDKKVGCRKKGSLAVDTRNSVSGSYVYRKNMDITLGKSYRVSVMVKTQNMSKKDLVTLELRFLKEKGFMGADMHNKRIYQYKDIIRGGTNGKWKKLQICFNIPAKIWNDVKAMAIRIIIGANRHNIKAWIDDVTIEEINGK
jgi:uncharacterized protein DUF4838